MFVLKALADKGKKIVEKTKKGITDISSKVYNYAANTRLASTINKYYSKLKDTTHATTKFITNLADRLLFRTRAQTQEERRLSEQQRGPEDLRDGKENPLDIKADKDIFLQRIQDRLVMADLNFPIEKYGKKSIFDIKDEVIQDIYKFIKQKLIEKKLKLGFRLMLLIEAEFSKSTPKKEKVYETKRITSGSFKRDIVYVGSLSDLEKVVNTCVLEIVASIEHIQNSATGYKFNKIKKIAGRLFYFKRSSDVVEISEELVKQGFKYRELPEWIRNSKSISNIKNNDDLCLIWAILRSLYPDKSRHHNKITTELREKYKQYEWFGLDKPSQITEENLCKFEDRYNFKIVIFKVGEEPKYKVIHLRRFENEDERRKIYLGFYIDHYFVINNLDGFVRCAYSKIVKHTGKIYVCQYCYKHLLSKESYQRHIMKCREVKIEYKMPKDRAYMYFQRIHSTLRYPAVVYADFEATSIPANSENCSVKSAVVKQIPNSFCIFCPDFKILEVRYNSNPEELFDEFWEILARIYKMLKQRYKRNESIKNPPPIPKDAKCAFCELVPEEFRSGDTTIVRHFDYFAGKFICYACKTCHAKAKKPKFVRVFFHNLKGYDSHFIIKYALKKVKFWKAIKPLGKSKEKLFAIKVPFHSYYGNGFYFLDSYSHLPFSLSQLVKDYVTEYRFKDFLPLNGEYKHKEAYPYEWMDNFDKFETKEFPPREAFFNRLTSRNLPEQEYQEVKAIYEKHCKTFKDYHDIYLKGDVILLAEVFEKYRDLSMESYGIDPAWYVSGPSFFYNAMMKMCKAKLPIIQDENLYRLVKRNIRGGICGVGEISEAEADKVNTSIASLDCVNLYGKAMMDPLPVQILEYVRADDVNQNNEEREEFNIANLRRFLRKLPENIGYIFEVDIVPPLDLHDFYKAYPLFPEKIDKKLVQTLNPKKNYLVLDKYLKYGLDIGYQVVKIHSFIKFKKTPIMRQYIEYNTEKRREASERKENSKVTYYKNANNSVYGKNIEDPEKYCNYLITRGDESLNTYSDGKWKDCIVIDDEEKIMLFDMVKETVYLDKPILLGFCILDISKEIMARHFYTLRNHLPFKLIYTDTDSFKIYCYEHGEKEVYEILKSLDFIETPESKVKKVPGKLAFEGFHQYFKAIASKHYIVDKKEKCKGVPDRCTTTEYKPERTYYSIRSKNHEIAIIENKKILKYEDDKKVKIGNENFPFGYKNTNV
ncbi:MAG: hypothetical protein K6T73_08670 [Candidatus Bathyarchaeota archaeon]|nr:hypothetical protein [Candidatus Bathyarchaeota archaeon]